MFALFVTTISNQKMEKKLTSLSRKDLYPL